METCGTPKASAIWWRCQRQRADNIGKLQTCASRLKVPNGTLGNRPWFHALTWILGAWGAVIETMGSIPWFHAHAGLSHLGPGHGTPTQGFRHLNPDP